MGETFDSAGTIRAPLSEEERAYYRRIFDQAKRDATAALAALRTAQGDKARTRALITLAHGPQEGMDAHTEAALEVGDGPATRAAIACRQGCSFCCHVNVSVTIPEAFMIAAGIRFEELDELQAAVKETAPKIAGLAPRARHRTATPCPLLEADGSCGIHDMRPNACRAYFSPDVAACEASLNAVRAGGDATKVPTLAFPHQIAAAYFAATEQALEDAGLQSCTVELTAALALILGDNRTLERWLAGVRVFAPYLKD